MKQEWRKTTVKGYSFRVNWQGITEFKNNSNNMIAVIINRNLLVFSDSPPEDIKAMGIIRKRFARSIDRVL